MSDEIKVGSKWTRKGEGWLPVGTEVVVDGESDDRVLYTVASGDQAGTKANSMHEVFLDLFDPVDPPAGTTPAHYDFPIQPIAAIRAWGLNFALGNVVKYVVRADRKGAPLDDPVKARDYLDDEIAERRKGAAK